MEERPTVSSSEAPATLKALTWAIALAFVVWSLVFIARSSFVAIDGHRYFSLFDDAMISMRFAWNLAHGAGLVWNPGGDRVEGYTNLLMTLLMSIPAALLTRSSAVMIVQLAGIPTLLGIAYVTRSLARQLGLGPAGQCAAFATSLAYYPLLYWTLMGMETGLLALLVGAAALVVLQRSDDVGIQYLLVLLLVLAYFTRPDALLFDAVLLAWRCWQLPARRRVVVVEALLLASVVVAASLGRLAYYGAVVPNTYTLKVTGIPLGVRLHKGVQFLVPFVQRTWALLAIAGITTVVRRRPVHLLFAGLVLAALSVDVWSGGDAWPYWRRFAPVVTFALLLSLDAAVALGRHRRLVAVTLCGGALALANEDFVMEACGAAPVYTARANARNVNTALALQAVTTRAATIGVFAAGALPYYADRIAYDFLGKSDRYIARLPPVLSGGGIDDVPGHNKYDLTYSIVHLRPTFTQGLQWGSQDVSPLAPTYHRYVYRRVPLLLDATSREVHWSLLNGAGGAGGAGTSVGGAPK